MPKANLFYIIGTSIWLGIKYVHCNILCISKNKQTKPKSILNAQTEGIHLVAYYTTFKINGYSKYIVRWENVYDMLEKSRI